MLADQRVGNAQRDHVLSLLGQAMREGYLAATEYEDRVVAASMSQRESELLAQLRDLPNRFLWQPGLPVPQELPDSAGRWSAWITFVLGLVSIPLGLVIIGALPAIAGIVCSFTGHGRNQRLRKVRDAGRIMSVAGMAISILILITVLVTA